MLSSKEQLIKRGYIERIDKDYEVSVLYSMLDSKNPQDRTIAIRQLTMIIGINNLDLAKIFINKLKIEKALYTKIEICKAFKLANKDTCKLLIPYLGKIGNNQYRNVPNKISKKKSYPLPRDIVARILAKTSINNIDIFIEALDDSLEIVYELIDVIGYMCFYNDYDCSTAIINLMEKYANNELLIWKCCMCLSAFMNNSIVIEYLEKIYHKYSNKIILAEINRSLSFQKSIE